MRYNLARIINAIVCIIGTIALMICVYHAWSQNGEYTIISFFMSLIAHGGIGVMTYLGIDYVIRRLFNKDEQDNHR